MRTHLFIFIKSAGERRLCACKPFQDCRGLSTSYLVRTDFAWIERNTTIIGKFNSFFQTLMRCFLIVANCQSLIREVFTTSRVYVKPDVGIRATTNQAPLLSSSCCELISTFLNKTGTQQGNCTLTHSGHKYRPNEYSSC